MKRLHVQIQTDRSRGSDDSVWERRLAELGVAEITRGEDKGPYLNVDYRTDDLRQLWRTVGGLLRCDPDLAACTIVCCERERGWDDYLLLHHYDPAEPLDQID